MPRARNASRIVKEKLSSIPWSKSFQAALLFVAALAWLDSPGHADDSWKLKILSDERIEALPEPSRSQWKEYLQRSAAFHRKEVEMLAQERSMPGVLAKAAPSAGAEFELPSKVDDAWINAQSDALIATVLSYQTPTGGWSKSVRYSDGPRARGMHWTSQSGEGWHYSGTLDNRATTEQMRFLAFMGSKKNRPDCRDAALRAIDYLLAAQYPNGGYPQVYPVEPGYHEAITLNDAAMLHALETLHAIAVDKDPEWEFVDQARRDAAAAALQKGYKCLLEMRWKVDGQPTLWCAQHDPLTYAPVSARLKEPPAISGGEGADVLKLLMRIGPIDAETQAAIRQGVKWLDEHRVVGMKRIKNAAGKTDYVPDPSSTEVYWARFYDIKTQKPIFAGAEDGIIYDSFSEMIKHNKVGYDYYTTRPKDIVTKEVERWEKRIAKETGSKK